MENVLISRYLKLFEPLSMELKLELLAALSKNIKDGLKKSRADKRLLFEELRGSWGDVGDDLEEVIYNSRIISDREINLD